MKRNFLIGCFFLASSLSASSQIVKLQSFPLASVRLLESPFKSAQETDLKYILSLNPDKLLAPFLREAGLQPLADSYGNWENTGLDGHIGGHYLSGLSEMYAATGNRQIKERLDYMLGWLEKCQQKNGNGYIGGVPGSKAFWSDIAEGKIRAGSFDVNGKWVPWYNLHKLYAGLVDAYRLTGNAKAKDMLIKLSDWAVGLTAKLSDSQIQQMLRSEHGGMNEAFADVAAITGNKKYLELARKFSHKVIFSPLEHHVDSLDGLHANTQIPKVIGFMRIAEVSGDRQMADAADFFWNTVVNHRTISIGGNSVREHFNPYNDFSPMLESREGPETCNSYNMLKLSKHLFLSNPSARYMDYYERTTYNHILSSQHPNGGFVYFTPIHPRHYRVYSDSQKSFWCCVGSGIENHGKYGELIYAHDDKDLYVNLFIPSTVRWQEKGLTLTQTTRFPYEEKTMLKMNLGKPARFAVKIRYPEWVKDGEMKIFVNNKLVSVSKDSKAYVSVFRTWKSGDQISVLLPMHTRAEQLPDKSAWVSFVHGPVVLAAATDSSDLIGLRADDSRMGHIARGPLYPVEEAPLLIADADLATGLKPVKDKSLTFTASDLIYQEKYKHLQLVPFYTIHDARYMVYWPYTTKEKLPQLQATLREKEETRMKLEAQTVDVVFPGEQQPESDHNFRGEKTNAGLYRERHYRNATGWFGYDMKNAASGAKKLSFTYYGGEKKRNFEVFVNDILLANVQLDGSEGNKFIEKVLDLPANAASAAILNVRFVASPGSAVAGIYELRLLK